MVASAAMLSSLSKDATSLALNTSEVALLLFGALLVLGLVGEYSESASWKRYIKTFELFVILGVAGELIADGAIFLLSSHLQTLSDVEVARLNNAAESANATAKKFESQIADANSKAEIARRDAESFRLDIAKAQGSASNAEAEALRLKKKMADRVCGNSEIAAIGENLKSFGGQEYQLSAYMEMTEPKAIAICIYQALAAAGWKYVPWEHGSVLIGGIGGVLVHFNPKDNAQTLKAASALAAILEKQGIASHLSQDASPDNRILIDVGTKP
jgi:hypothetical protein